MPSLDSPAILVARFLRTNNYHETLKAFLQEAGLPPDAGSSLTKDDLTIEKVLQEKRVYDVSIQFEKLGVEDEQKKWTIPAPSAPKVINTMPTTSNILKVAVHNITVKSETVPMPLLLATTADRRLNLVKPKPTFDLFRSLSHIQDSPILSCAVIEDRYLLCSSMSGKVVLYDVQTEDIVDERRDHTKYVVQVASCIDDADTWIATAGWDAKILLYRVRASDTGSLTLGQPVAQAALPTNPESMLFVRKYESAPPSLLVTRRDSTFLYYYHVPDPVSNHSVTQPAQLVLQGKQNLAPQSNAWIAFTPSSMAISPVDPTLLAVATSAVPHLKLILVRLLFPTTESSDVTSEASNSISLLDSIESFHPTQAAQARAALALQDREAAAIQIHCTTLAPQTQYSTPALAWRPDGSGVWVNSDDGVVRGIETSTGKIVATLEGHEVGSKIRCLWAGMVAGESGPSKEWLISGGFDQRLIVWSIEN